MSTRDTRLPGTQVAQRLMPQGHWDWSMPVPFSQGWRCGDFIFVGGQISSDKDGRTIGVGDLETQTRNVFENIRKVLQEAGADMDDVVKFNTYYVFEGSGDEIREFWETLTRIACSFGPALRHHRNFYRSCGCMCFVRRISRLEAGTTTGKCCA